jgi:hypothetical protein
VRLEVGLIVIRGHQDFRFGRNARSYGSPKTAKLGEQSAALFDGIVETLKQRRIVDRVGH